MKMPHLFLLFFLSLHCSPASEACQFAQSPSMPAAAVAPAPPPEQASPAIPANSKGVVYVGDFELRVMNPSGSPTAGAAGGSEAGSSNAPTPNAPTSNAPTSNASMGNAPRTRSSTAPQSGAAAGPKAGRSIWQETDLPQTRASKLVDFLSTSLLRTLEKAGYTARRLKAGEIRSEKGVLLRGVFAETDEQNHIRLALLGSGAPAAEFQLYWGVQNLARADQPLYEIANPNSPGLQPAEGKTADGRYGPVITVTSFAPVARFAMAKEPTEEQVQKIAADIVASLTTLLSANPAVMAE
jgi:Domain of unknown function (DUF4410)